MGKKFWTTDKLVALTALFISLLTLCIFIWQTKVIEKQSHLSVMPYLMMDSANNSENYTFSIDLVNHGVGPAFIDSKSFIYKNQSYSDLQFIEFLRDHMPEMDSINVINHTTINIGQAIPAGKKVNIIKAGGDLKSYTSFLKVMQRLADQKFNYEIFYKSIYDDRWKIDGLTEIPEEL